MHGGEIRCYTIVNRWGFLARAAGGRRAGRSALCMCVYIRNIKKKSNWCLIKNEFCAKPNHRVQSICFPSELPRTHSSPREHRFSFFGEYLILFELASSLGRISNHFLGISKHTRQRTSAIIHVSVKGACVGTWKAFGIGTFLSSHMPVLSLFFFVLYFFHITSLNDMNTNLTVFLSISVIFILHSVYFGQISTK